MWPSTEISLGQSGQMSRPVGQPETSEGAAEARQSSEADDIEKVVHRRTIRRLSAKLFQTRWRI
jgi:hypothetical protein